MHKAVRCANKGWERALFGALTVLALIAFVAPGKILQFAPPCLFDFVGFEHCWGCGMTHAVLACLHGQFQLAWDANPRVFIVLPLMVGGVSAFCTARSCAETMARSNDQALIAAVISISTL